MNILLVILFLKELLVSFVCTTFNVIMITKILPVFSKNMKNEAVFTKTEMNNE